MEKQQSSTLLSSFPHNSGFREKIPRSSTTKRGKVSELSSEFAVYVHIPFCMRKCPYCDFVSRAVDRSQRIQYLEALSHEIASSPWHDSQARTLFVGGGTPSELTGDEIEKVTEALSTTFSFAPDAEWTIECNPATVSPPSCDRLLELGFNRVSIGVQSFDDRHLTRLGRIHSAQDAIETYQLFRDAGFENINLDLIFGVPGQTPEEWLSDLETAIDLHPEHLSLYSLTVEPGTEFGRLRDQGLLEMADQDVMGDMYEAAMDTTDRAGYEHYEISNFSLPGFECEHNFFYWSNSWYLGFGIAAASYVGGRRWASTNNWEDYLSGAVKGSVPKASEEQLEPRKAMAEEAVLRLRTRSGIAVSELAERYACDFEESFGDSVGFLTQHGLLDRTESTIRLTRKGKLLFTEVWSEFLRAGS
ncbi:MAG TPA: radical SAM family heme chaperone HemW [Acidobacteriota bacterium]|nr:radical SAM family heme chaperone HemW [Acidobacteriota bacterium]